MGKEITIKSVLFDNVMRTSTGLMAININGITTKGTIVGLSLCDKRSTDDRILTIGDQLEKGICRYAEDD